MFLNWFSGHNQLAYQTSPYKQRIDQLGAHLLKLRYANEVIRQHLHEWLRFSSHLNNGPSLPAMLDKNVRGYMAQRTRGLSASRSRVLRVSIRIFLDADEQGQFCRRIDCPPFIPDWFTSILEEYLHFVQSHRGSGSEDAKEIQPTALIVRAIPGECWHHPALCHYAGTCARVLREQEMPAASARVWFHVASLLSLGGHQGMGS
jgi:hypothetical protein